MIEIAISKPWQNFNSKENDKNISSLKRKLSSFVQPSEQLNIIDDDFNR